MSNSFIPLSVPYFGGNERKYVNEAIVSEWVSTGGAYIVKFENEIAEYLGVFGATACQSGTAGLHLAMIASGIGVGDEVIAPTLTFIAAINPIKYVGAEPVFIDCDDSLCISPDKLEEFLEQECLIKNGAIYNKRSHAHIKAVLVVHIFGNMADMERILYICKKYSLIIIEDATEALGSRYTHGAYTGKYAGTIGDIGVYSFNGNKIITTGGGGMVVCREEAALERIRYLSKQAKDDDVNFVHNAIGYNYRMTNLQAALGVAQLEQLETFIDIKRNNFNLYKKELEGCQAVEILNFREGIRPNCWFYSIFIKYGVERDDIIKYLRENNIQSRSVWVLNHMQKPYLRNQSYSIENAYTYRDRIVNIPCSSNLLPEDVKYVAENIRRYCAGV